MCFGIYVLNNFFVERCFWEIKMLFGSLVELHGWLHSYLYFSLLEKLFFKQSLQLIDSFWHLAYLSSSLVSFNHILNSFSIALQSIEKVCLLDSCLIAPWSIELVLLWTPLDSCSIAISLHAFRAWHLSTPLDLSRIMKSDIFIHRDFRFTSLQSLSIALVPSPLKTPFFHSKLHPQ